MAGDQYPPSPFYGWGGLPHQDYSATLKPDPALAEIAVELKIMRRELSFIVFSLNLLRHQENADMTTIKDALDQISAKADEEKTFIAGVSDRVQKIIDSENSNLSDADSTELSNIISALGDHETVLSGIAQTAATATPPTAVLNAPAQPAPTPVDTSATGT